MALCLGCNTPLGLDEGFCDDCWEQTVLPPAAIYLRNYMEALQDVLDGIGVPLGEEVTCGGLYDLPEEDVHGVIAQSGEFLLLLAEHTHRDIFAIGMRSFVWEKQHTTGSRYKEYTWHLVPARFIDSLPENPDKMIDVRDE